MHDHLIDDFGAVGDGVTLDTNAIQRAIDSAHATGGGRVVLTPGKIYLAGSVVVKSHVELHVPSGSTLLASPRFDDFAVVQSGVVQMDEPASAHSSIPTASFIFADDAEDVSITGRGVIDGNGRSYITQVGDEIHVAEDQRVFTVHFRDVRRVAVTDIRIVDGSSWTVRLSRCDDVVVHAITIDNDVRMPNNDGLDIDACRRVRISDCDIRAGDDAICLKAAIESTRDGRVCEDVTITGCTLVSSSTAILCGVECDTAIRNVVVSACVIRSSNRGIAVSLHERGVIERIRFENIVVETRMFDERWWGHGEPLYVAAVARHERVGSVSDVTFRGITARSPRGAFVFGDGDGSLRDIRLVDCELTIVESPAMDPHVADIRPVPTGGLFADAVSAVRIHGARDVSVDGLRMRWEGLDGRRGDAVRVTESIGTQLSRVQV